MGTSFSKIIATIGPASQREDTLRSMVQAGMAIARLNFSHGEQADHRRNYETIRRVARDLDLPIAIIQDLQGPKIRVGKFPGDKLELEPGSAYTLSADQTPSPYPKIPVDASVIASGFQEGQRVLFADGHLEGRVRQTDDQGVVIDILLGGVLRNNQGINFPGVRWEFPPLTEKDLADLAFGLKLGVDAIAISFVRSAEDVLTLRKTVEKIQADRSAMPLIAKLERPEGLENLEEIIKIADGVMVARGDLGVEMDPEDVPVAQKLIIEAANRNEKIVITATQMLDSMINNPRPTRAEASDVANAIFDGTDAVMLSGETAIGKYPVESIRTMREIILQAEKHLGRWGRVRDIPAGEDEDGTIYVTRAATKLSQDPRVKAIAVFSQTGRTPRLISKSRPRVPILGFTSEKSIFHRMQLEWGSRHFGSNL